MNDPDGHDSADPPDGESPEEAASSHDDEVPDGGEPDDDHKKAERWNRAIQLATDAATLVSALLTLYQVWRHGG